MTDKLLVLVLIMLLAHRIASFTSLSRPLITKALKMSTTSSISFKVGFMFPGQGG